MNPRICLCCLFWGLYSSGLIGCSQPTPPEPPLVPVTVARPLTEDVSQYVLINGRSEESATFEVRARVEGKLEGAEFQEGALVTKGQILFEIEKAPFESDLKAAKALLEAAKAQKESAAAQKQTADARHNAAEAAHDLAIAERNRTKTLFDKQVATQSELDLRDAQVKVAAAEIDTAHAALSDADAAMSVAEAAIQREDAGIEQATIQLGYTTIRSEVDGLAGEILVDPGNLIGKGENTLLTTVRQIDPLDIYFEAPERAVLQLLRGIYEGRRQINQDVIIEVQFESEEGYPHKGHLVLIDNRVDPNTGTTLLRGVIPNPYRGKDGKTGEEVPFKERQYLLRPGAYAKIRIQTEPIPDAVLVHETAIGTDLTGKYLLIVNDKDEVELRRVRLGQRYQQFRRIEAIWKPDEAEPEGSTAPVDSDFRYILDGLLRSRPGITVDVTEEVEMTYSMEGPASDEQKGTEDSTDSEESSKDDSKPAESEADSRESGPPKKP